MCHTVSMQLKFGNPDIENILQKPEKSETFVVQALVRIASIQNI